MPQITLPIQTQSFELVRDRIGEILADELPEQAILIGDTDLNATVFRERFVPMSSTELPAVNVYLARGEYNKLTNINQDGVYSYNIDVYTSAATTNDERGDSLAMVKLQKLMGVVHGILSHQAYLTLGFAPGLIGHRSVKGLAIQQPGKGKDAESVVMGRLMFDVKAADVNERVQGTLIAGYQTTVKLHESEQGYFWEST